MNGRKKFNTLGWLTFAGVLLLWELAARGNPKLQLYFPPVSQIAVALGGLISSEIGRAHV